MSAYCGNYVSKLRACVFIAGKQRYYDCRIELQSTVTMRPRPLHQNITRLKSEKKVVKTRI